MRVARIGAGGDVRRVSGARVGKSASAGSPAAGSSTSRPVVSRPSRQSAKDAGTLLRRARPAPATGAWIQISSSALSSCSRRIRHRASSER